MKPYRFGCVLGRFNPLHIGHEHLINVALEVCEDVLVFVGSSQESRTERNPFSYEERKAMLEEVFGDKIIVAPLPDLGLGDVPAWGDHLIEEARRLGYQVDCFVLGEESKNDKWFSPDVKAHLSFHEVSRFDIPISATSLREAIRKGERKTFDAYTPKALHPHYREYKEILLNIS